MILNEISVIIEPFSDKVKKTGFILTGTQVMLTKETIELKVSRFRVR